MPSPEVAFAWGSASISSTFFSNTPNEAAKLTVVVVFPTPPFWFAIAMILPIIRLLLGGKNTIIYAAVETILLTGSEQPAGGALKFVNGLGVLLFSLKTILILYQINLLVLFLEIVLFAGEFFELFGVG